VALNCQGLKADVGINLEPCPTSLGTFLITGGEGAPLKSEQVDLVIRVDGLGYLID
jgi:hypothetical protein